MNEVALRPSYWAKVSGGKDSLFMLKLILNHPEKYPLDGVLHYELEIDYPWIRDVIDYMEAECVKHGIKFLRIKPRKSWESLYERFGFPSRRARWCLGRYKLDAARQLEEHMRTLGCYVVSYIGYCADEQERFYNRKECNGTTITEVYPLVEYGIKEKQILKWAQGVDLFHNYYKSNRRAGCMYCPMSDKINLAYLYKYYPDKFEYMMGKMKETEARLSKKYGRKFCCTSSDPKYDAYYIENIVKTKYLAILNEKEKSYGSKNE